jgi:hypothetical protein
MQNGFGKLFVYTEILSKNPNVRHASKQNVLSPPTQRSYFLQINDIKSQSQTPQLNILISSQTSKTVDTGKTSPLVYVHRHLPITLLFTHDCALFSCQPITSSDSGARIIGCGPLNVAEIVRARLLRDVTTEKWGDRLCGIFAPLARAPNSVQTKGQRFQRTVF